MPLVAALLSAINCLSQVEGSTLVGDDFTTVKPQPQILSLPRPYEDTLELHSWTDGLSIWSSLLRE